MPKKLDILTGRHVIDPMSGKPMRKGRPVENAGPSKPPASVVPDPRKSMPKDRLAYHRNPKVELEQDMMGTRYEGSVGRAIAEGKVMRKGRPQNAAYSGDTTSKIGLGLNRVADTIQGMDDQLFKKKKGKK